ncbi:MAG: nodulation protein NfeD [Candidatus Bipolaricaulota bacterium]|nr:nodulation protein NfeD [Candidatus Bipolaricaulota bacterium]MDW8329984.1 nodulation protein NfeD [Candidatus Bipolaricaulota bacterium]
MRYRWGVAILSLGLGAALVLGQSQAPAPLVAYAELASSINPITKDFLLRVITEAHRDNAALLIVRLDTPGGLLESTKDMVSAILNSPIPIVVWVGPGGARAASAGAFITMAADIAAMAEGTNIGSSTPVSLAPSEGQPPNEDDPARKKIMEFVASEARKIAEKRGRSKEWAEKFVFEGKSLTAREALENNIINLIANTREELLKNLDGYELQRDGQIVRLQTSGASLKIYERNLKEQLMGYLADPNVVYLLLTIGIYALIAEFFTPGFGVGIAGAICLLLALLGLQVLPFNVVGLALIGLGVVLMVIDLFAPTHMALTIGGIVSLLIGSFMLFDVEGFAAPALNIHPATIFVTVGTVTALFVFMATKGLLIQRKRVSTGREGLVGARGSARDDLQPEGMVFVKGEYWRAIAQDPPIKSGETIIVEAIEDGKLLVRRKP